MIDPGDQKVVDDVAEHGWHCVHITADEEGPNFSFSVGWWETLGTPETIVFGLRREVHHNLLWILYQQIQNGLRIADGLRISGLLEGFECIARRVDLSQMSDHFGYALWYRALRLKTSDGLEAFQIFWPGKVDGLYPWEAGCSQIVRDHQPLLYLPKETGLA